MATALLSLGRIGVGALSLLLPATASKVFLLAPPGGHTTTMRLFGVRDATLGAYLWYATRPPSTAAAVPGEKAGATGSGSGSVGLERERERERGRKRRVKDALTLGVIVDSIDAVSSAVCVLEGNLKPMQWPLIGGGAVFLLLLAWMAWPEEESTLD